MSERVDKVASVIKRALAQPISDIARINSAGMATVTDVRVTKDLSIARVYVSCFGGKVTPVAFIEILGNEKPKLRHLISGEIKLRIMPDLKFYYDDSLDKIDHIQKLIDSNPPAVNNIIDENVYNQ